jgi:DNA-binding MarR family transcriptional regulator
MGQLKKEIRQGKNLPLETEVFLNVVRTADVLVRGETELLKPFGISVPQYNVLRILRGAGGEGLRCSDIAERLVARDPDVTRLLDRLERGGLASRRRDSGDRRVVVTSITPAGEDVLRSVDGPSDQVHRDQLAQLSPTELRTLCRLLEKARETPAKI